MATIKQFLMQGAFEIMLRKPKDMSMIAYLVNVKTNNLNNTIEMAYASGGQGNVYIGGAYGHSRRATLEVSVGTFATSVMAAQNGIALHVGITNAPIHEYITLDADKKGATKFTATGTVSKEITSLNIVEGGTTGAPLVQAAVVAAGKFAYDTATKEITFNAAEAGIAVGTVIEVSYNFDTGSDATKVDVNANGMPELVHVTAFIGAKEVCTGVVYPAIVTGYAQIDGNWNLELSADGGTAVQNLNLEFVTTCSVDRNLYSMIVYDPDTVGV